MRTPLERYHGRMQRVLDHVDAHADDALDLETLAGIAAFSKHHFHRQFSALFGVSVHRYVQLVRMKRASYRLAYRPDKAVTDIALDAGYEAPEAFARAFRQRFGQAPSAFRAAPDWQPWHAALAPLTHARSQTMPPRFTPEDVTILAFPATPVALLSHRGDPARLGDTLRRFIAWRKLRGLRPPASATYNIFHGDPRGAAPEAYRLDLCAGTAHPVADPAHGIEPGLIPAGRCAMLRVIGQADDLEPAALFLYRDWLPASGEEPGDFPLFARRVTFFPDVPEDAAVTELYLPLR
ncbi:AraC family transcriptional regulator [Sphingomonas sp. HT-1]|uniref:AraC family transcriptional regulator n=1 Tax=unclassified Sphingomonas TaxID=196159 RepID=UPI000474775C|nr:MULTISPECIES: AraC family transcriptional regulator [unclassified Sphingomonas]KTF68747.1 AraC family transcriptional regulator [Sphingomonas sp. WG]